MADKPDQIEKRSGRSAVIAADAMVATSQPLATLTGVEVLRQGGNAVDAAIAANAMLGLVEPMSCGIGGDLFAMVWDAKTAKLYGLNGSGRSPYSLTRSVFIDHGMDQIPMEGPLSWSVPGCVRGWEDLRARFGSMPLDRLLAPAIDYAQKGFAVTPVIAGHWKAAEASLQPWADSVATYLPDGGAPVAGQIFSNANLAISYQAIAEDGPDAFYQGDIARRILGFSQACGGHFAQRDFSDHRSQWVEPVSTNYRGYEVWELPPNGQGIAALQILNLLELDDLAALGRDSADYAHLFIEAKKLAFADRARFYADPDFQNLPVAELISKEYARRRRTLIDPKKALTDISHGDPVLRRGDTIYLSVVDKDRNCCSLIQSNYFGFGSMVVPGDVGFALQNRGSLFALDDEHPNRLEPHKRPFHTIIPAMVTKDDKPWLCFGVMGGDMQPQGHVQILNNMIDFGMNVQQAGEAPRIRHAGSATATGICSDEAGGLVFIEPGIPDQVIDDLKARGHRAQRGGVGFGGYQAVMIDGEHNTLQGGSDPRKDGCAMGY